LKHTKVHPVHTKVHPVHTNAELLKLKRDMTTVTTGLLKCWNRYLKL